MPTETRISVRLASKVNLGNFENIEFDFGISEDTPEGMTRGEHFDKLFGWVWERLEKNVDEARRAARG